MKFAKTLNSLCAPAQFYLYLSLFIIIVVVLQNLMNGNPDELCIGSFKCDYPNVFLLLILKMLYIGIWTWFLNLICYIGLKSVSWFIVIVPFLLAALVVANIMFTNNQVKEVYMIKNRNAQ